MNGGRLQLTLRELHQIVSAKPLWLTFAAIVALFTVTGPYGTAQSMALMPRLAFWLMLNAGTWIAGIAGVVAGLVLLEPVIENRLVRIFLGALFATPAVALAIMLTNWGWHGSPISGREFAEQFLAALPLTFVFSGICFLVMRGDRSGPAAALETTGAKPVRSSLLDRLKPENRAPILSLTAEDHYTAVTTARGKELVLVRFSDSMNELEAEDGIQVHRSHWIARNHIASIKREDGKIVIINAAGDTIPVSRNRAKPLMEWFERA